MSRSTRWAVALMLSLAPLAGLTYAYPEWPGDAGLDLWNLPTLRSEIELRQRQHDDLEAKLQATGRRMATKNEIVRDLIDGRLTLREAIVGFRAANADNPRFVPVMRFRFPDASEDELQARNVVDTAAGLLEHDPRRAVVLARLHDDLQAMRRDGIVTLD